MKALFGIFGSHEETRITIGGGRGQARPEDP